MFGVVHGAIQFMTYEEMKSSYNRSRKLPHDNKLVSFIGLPCCTIYFFQISLVYVYTECPNPRFNGLFYNYWVLTV